MDYEKMGSDWVEIGPGVFSTELGGLEKIYRTASQAFKQLGHEHWGLYDVCTFEFGPSFPSSDSDRAFAVRNAWIDLRYEFPGLALVPEGLTKKTYTLPNTASVNAWADETFFVAHAATDPDSVLAAYPLRDLPSLYFFPESSSVLLLVSHWRVDGVGTCMLLNRLFSLLAAGSRITTESWKPDMHKLSPGIQDALGAPKTVTPELEALARQYIADHHKSAVHAAGLRFHGDASTPPENPSRTAVVFTAASTAALVASCKAGGITVTAAAHAALAEVVFDLSPDNPTKYAAVVSVNMRDRLMPPYNSPDHAVQAYVTGVTPSVDRTSSFEEKAKQLTAFYKTGWYSEQFLQAYRLMTQYQAEALSKPRPQGMKPPSNVTLSSLGVVEKYLTGQYGSGGNTITVLDFRFGVSMMTRQMLLYVWTFRGKLNLSVNYNSAYHDAGDAGEFLEAIRGVLSKNLKVNLEFAA